MYTIINFRSKKALKKAIEEGTEVHIYQPGPFQGNEPKNGVVCLEGPHYPEPHRWYAEALLKDGRVVSFK